MAHQSFFFHTKDNENIPEEIKTLLLELVNTLQQIEEFDSVYMKEDCFALHYYQPYYPYDDVIEELISVGKVTDNIKKAYHWLIEHTELEVDCWNVNDYEYGPSNIEDLKETVNYYWNKNKK